MVVCDVVVNAKNVNKSPRAGTSASLFRWPEARGPWQWSLLAPPAPPHGVAKAVGLSRLSLRLLKFAGRGVFSSASNLMPIFTTSSVQGGPCLSLDYHMIPKLSQCWARAGGVGLVPPLSFWGTGEFWDNTEEFHRIITKLSFTYS